MLKILVIDDEKTLNNVLSTMLQRVGFDVTQAFSFNEGTKLFTQIQPSIVLLDLGLNDGDGMELLKMFRAQNPQTQIFVITCNNEEDVKNKALSLGAVEYITKPLNAEHIRNLIAQRISSHASLPTPVKPKILIVEDEEGIVFAIKSFLERYFDCDITATFSGGQGLELLQTNTFDLAICDIGLQDISGLDIIAKCRQSKTKTSFIVITAYTSQEYLKRAAELNVLYYIIKPLDVLDLKSKIQIVLSTMNKFIPKK